MVVLPFELVVLRCGIVDVARRLTRLPFHAFNSIYGLSRAMDWRDQTQMPKARVRRDMECVW